MDQLLWQLFLLWGVRFWLSVLVVVVWLGVFVSCFCLCLVVVVSCLVYCLLTSD